MMRNARPAARHELHPLGGKARYYGQSTQWLEHHFEGGDRILVREWAYSSQWVPATVIEYRWHGEPGKGTLLLYVRRDGSKHEEGHTPTTDNFRPGGAQLQLLEIS